MLDRYLPKQTREAVKEFGRVVVLAVLPIIYTALENPEMSFKALVISIVIAGLKAVDKYIHEKGKVENDETMIKGLTRF